MHRETRVSNYALAAFSALALVMLSLPMTAPVRKVKAGVVYLLNPLAYYGAKGEQRLADVPPGLARLLRADLENVRLQAQLREALWQKAELEALRTENRRLAQALGLKPPPGYAPLWADVMERDSLHWYNSIMVGAGAQQGVSLNAPVFGDQDGTLVAIGRVTEVRQDSSMVLLVTDELSSVAAYLSTSAVEGLVQGQGGPRLRMNYLPSEVALSTGDLVYTSPTSATFPGEILLGRVAAINPRDPFLTFQSVEVHPAADAAALSHVMILLKAGRGPRPTASVPAAAPPMTVRKSTGTAEGR
jgi:rod shape-determining protein MreC